MLRRTSKLSKLSQSKRTSTKKTTTKKAKKEEPQEKPTITVIKSKAEFMRLHPNIKIK